MLVNRTNYTEIVKQLSEGQVLVAVSKTKPAEAVLELYELGQRDFGENYVQELCDKQAALPADIRWHFIGHLQRNKVKYIAPFVHMIHGIDSERLLEEVNKQAQKLGRTIDVLLQVHIAKEETKFGLDEAELSGLLDKASAGNFPYVRIRGLMGMASFTEDAGQVGREFSFLSGLYDQYAERHSFTVLSMGMSADYPLALENGSTMIRVGSLLFGAREKTQ